MPSGTNIAPPQFADTARLDHLDLALYRSPRRGRIAEGMIEHAEGGHRPTGRRVCGLCFGGECSCLGGVGARTLGIAGERLEEGGVGEHPHLIHSSGERA